MLYQMHEFQRTMLGPLTAWANTASKSLLDRANPLSFLPGAEKFAAGCQLINRLGKEYEKPVFGITSVIAHGKQVSIAQRTILEKSFCRLLRFKRYADDAETINKLKQDPVVLVCA